MAEENKKTHRSEAEIQQDYARVCAKAGNMQYQIAELQKDLTMVNNQMRELNFEFAAAKRREEEALAKKSPVEAVPALEGLK